jgi:hypothetical protein
VCRGGLNGFQVVGTINVERGWTVQQQEWGDAHPASSPARERGEAERCGLGVARPRVCARESMRHRKKGDSRSANSETSAKRQARLDLRFNLVLHPARIHRETPACPLGFSPSASTDSRCNATLSPCLDHQLCTEYHPIHLLSPAGPLPLSTSSSPISFSNKR